MSADDFQTKYASVMESMLKGAVAETTKLFETMVDDLKAEITKIKKENEDLKRKCSQFEDERGKTVCDIQERESDPRRSEGSGKRDTAVQCDLVPFRTVLVEQCEPLQPSSWQNQVQQCGFDTMQYVWQEHNYENRDERNSQMAVILVKQEDLVDSSQQSDFKQEDGSPLMSDGVLEKEGHVVNEEYPSAEIPSALENEDTQVSLELFNVGLDNSLLGVHNQPSDLGNSLSALKGDREKGSGIGMQISETRTPEDPMTLEKHPTVIAQNQPEIELHENEQPADGKVSVNEQTDADLPSQLVDTQYTEEQSSKPTPPNKSQAVDESKNATSEAEPPPPVRRRRGRPPKKAKPVKQVLLPSSTVSAEQEVKNSPTTRMGKTKASIVESLNITSSRSSLRSRIHPKESSPFINLSVQEKVNTFLEDKENSTVDSLAFLGSPQSRKPSFENKKASETHQLSMVTKDGSAQASPIELSSTAQKQNSPTTESPQEPSLRSRERCTSVTLQDAMLLVEAMNQSTEENTQCSPQKVAATAQTLKTVEEARVESEKQLIPEEAKSHAPPQTTDATATTEARAHIKNTTPKQQHPATPSTAGKPSVATSTTATQTNVKSFQEHPPHPTLKSVMQSKQSDSVHHKIIVMSRSSTSVMSCKFAGKSQTQLPSVVSTVIAAQNNGELPRLTPTGTLPGKPSLCSIPQKTLYVSPQKLHPVISLQSTPPPPDPRSGPLSQPKLTILIPRQQSAAATRKQSQAADLSTKQESAKSSDAVQLTPSEFMSSSQVFRVSDDAQITFDEAAPITENLEPHQQTLNEPSDTSSSLDLSYGPTAMSSASPLIDEQKPSAVIRLIRLPFQMSTKEAVLLSHLSTSESSDTESVSKERTMKEKPSFLGLSVQPLETRVSPSDTYCISKETSVAVSDRTSQISDIQEGASLDTVSDEPTDREYVQFSAPPFLKSATAIHATESSASFGMPSEPSATQLEKEIRSMLVQGSAGPEDPPMEPQSPAVIHLLSIKSRDITDPHVQMTKAQFLAQLAVSPIVQEQNQTFNSVDADASCLTSTSDKKSIQRNNLVAKLRCHLKTHSQARNSVRNQEPCTETETLTASPKKPRLETDSPDDPMTGPVPLSLDKQGTVVDTTAPEKTEDDPSPISSRKSGVCKDGVRSKRCVSEPAPVNSRRLKAMNDSILVSHGRSTYVNVYKCFQN
ncbi:uncharacterized protein LOC117816247 isoform X1 [Xyrichtys novacula]|uniref:Uncharacterized protein LOC117816247 isoform X1 n=1 Tax=Xyrichtys novacula TaxID=13765 RepID=A0AAV1EVU1_XYRNO|nr:uncharacterized protein LOC117816247 isoform X1 [Xyrichtys novacula]